ncbi:sulfatase [Arenibacter sp. S6351L]|uniref:sulfatase family protein n=1 Tax=Arenibacter sp. S6351L TaxID=2926407 RepID=UPI001FF4B000|nr:sulfatase [Arenibacter sp. S6351L]MCK0137021.1 sulfatase [Arenibacter sp. S6351L]
MKLKLCLIIVIFICMDMHPKDTEALGLQIKNSVEYGQGPQPNILIIIADDCTFSDLTIYGGRNVDTPNIDLLASESLVFNRAYLSMAMCAPSRAELFTGKYPQNNGVAYNHGKAKKNIKSIVQYLAPLGYRTGIAGKIHLEPKSVFPFEKVEGLERNCVAKTAEFDSAGMEEFIARDNGPFCLVTSLVVPHAPWTVGDATHFNKEQLILPSYMADTPETRENYSRYLAEIEVLDEQVGMTLQMLKKSGKADNTIVIFTTEQGSKFPFNKWTNYDMGVHTGFIVCWPGKTPQGKRTDALIQYADVLPTLLDAAGGQLNEKDFDGSSFLGVIKDNVSKHRKFAYGMHNNIPEGPPYPIRSITDGNWHYIKNIESESIYVLKHLMGTTRTSDYWSSWLYESTSNEHTLILVNRYLKRPAEELYHTSEDPFEQNNLAENSRYQELKLKLSQELENWTERNDNSTDSWEAYNETIN